MGELTGLPAIALAALVARREASAEEVVAAHLHRIDAVNDAINAVVVVDGERALADAREADAAYARGEPRVARRPVHREGQPRGGRAQDDDRRPGARAGPRRDRRRPAEGRRRDPARQDQLPAL